MTRNDSDVTPAHEHRLREQPIPNRQGYHGALH